MGSRREHAVRPDPRRPLVIATLASLVTACGGGAGSAGGCEVLQLASSGPGDVLEHFPTTSGSAWSYSVTDSTSSSPQRLRVSASGTPDGRTAFTTANLDGAATDTVTVYAKTAAGVTLASDPALPAQFDGYSHPWLVFPLDPGRTVQPLHCTRTSLGTDVDGDGKADAADLDLRVSVLGDEVVNVPAGTFTARRVETRGTFTVHGSAGGTGSGSVTEVDWLAPGIGVVRQTLSASANGMTQTSEASLVGYELGARRGGIVPHARIASAITSGDSDTNEVRVALAAGGGSLLAAWRQPGGFQHDTLRAAFVDPAGTQPSTLFDVFDLQGASDRPAIAFDGANHLVVSNLCTTTTGCGLLAQRISPGGARLDGGSGLSIAAGGNSVYAPGVAGGAGGWLVAWTTYTEGIYVAPVSATGQVGVTTLLRANATANMGSVLLGVGYADGTYLVAWTEGAWWEPMTVFASRVTPQGVVLDDQPIPISTAPGAKSVATVASDGSRFYVVYLDGRSGALAGNAPSLDVYVARVGTDGVLVDGPAGAGGVLVNAYAASKRDATALWDGHQLVVTWWVDGYGPPGGVYAARVTGSGVLVDGPPSGMGVEVSHTRVYAARLVNPALASRGDGSALVAWTTNPESTDSAKSIDAALLYW